MTTVDPEELPFKTAPEYVDEFLADIDVSNEVVERSRKYAKTYGVEDSINRSPRTVAAASIYVASLLSNEKLTQEEVHQVADVSKAAIRQTYHVIVVEEGYETPGRRHEQERKTGRQRGGIIGRIRNWGDWA